MSLATQLRRGTLAVPMLLAFAGLGIIANQRAEAEPVGVVLGALVAPAAERAERVEQRLVRRIDQQVATLDRLGAAQARAIALGQQLSRMCGARATRNHVLVLAQAPADLGTLAVRLNTSCRA